MLLLPLEEGLPGLVGEAWPSQAPVGEELPVAALVVELPASVASYFVYKSHKYIYVVIIHYLFWLLPPSGWSGSSSESRYPSQVIVAIVGREAGHIVEQKVRVRREESGLQMAP